MDNTKEKINYTFNNTVTLQGCEDSQLHIREFQAMMHRIYFHRDSLRGALGTYDWLVEEVRELGEAMKNGGEKALKDEFADVLAWLASLANVTNVNLEDAALNKYSDRCPKCEQSPCHCPS